MSVLSSLVHVTKHFYLSLQVLVPFLPYTSCFLYLVPLCPLGPGFGNDFLTVLQTG